MQELEEIKQDVKELKSEIKDIKDNHLDSIYASIQFILKDIANLRWFIMGGIAVLAIVITLIQCFG